MKDDNTKIILTLLKFAVMTLIIETKNKAQLSAIKRFLEEMKDVRFWEGDNSQDLPDEIYEALEKYADSVKEEDCISSEEFFLNARKKVCELYSQK